MAINTMLKTFDDAITANSSLIRHNCQLFDIYEGQLLPILLAELKGQLSENSFRQIQARIAPINVLRRIVDKLSKIYMEAPVRRVEGGTEKDSELLKWFVDILKMDRKMNTANEFFNLFKNCLLQPVIDPEARKPILRVIPSDRFIVLSTNKIDPTTPTHVVTFEGKAASENGSAKIDLFAAYSKDEWVLFDSDGKIRKDLMAQTGNEQGTNIYGALPFVYVNRSENLLVPKPDSDTLAMTKVIPIILSDLNFAVMYQCFSIVYTIDTEDQNVTMAPNALWTLRSLGDGEKKPEIGVIKPQVDIQQVIGLVQSQLSFWLQTRGIRPGSIGQLTNESSASGISKMIDEMDTSEDRQKQVQFFKQAESELWDLILKHMHPVWVAQGLVDQTYIFTPSASVEVDFPEQLPLQDRAALVITMKQEVEAGFTTRAKAIARLNPGMDDESVMALLEEIEAERYGDSSPGDEAGEEMPMESTPDANRIVVDDGSDPEE